MICKKLYGDLNNLRILAPVDHYEGYISMEYGNNTEILLKGKKSQSS